jgi:hypothetical protein
MRLQEAPSNNALKSCQGSSFLVDEPQFEVVHDVFNLLNVSCFSSCSFSQSLVLDRIKLQTSAERVSTATPSLLD